MNYLKEILAFNNWIEYNSQINKSDICLWYALIDLANRFNWAEFTVPISRIILKSKLKRDAIYRSRNKLKQFGILDFKERSGNQCAIYKMNSVASIYATQNAIQEVFVSQYETQNATQSATQSATQNATQSATINKTKNQKLKTKNKKEIKKKKFGEFKNVLLTEDEFFRLEAECGPMLSSVIEYLSTYIEMKGYKANSHYLAIKKWVISAVKEQQLKDERLKQLEGGGSFDRNRSYPPRKLCTDYPE